MVKAQSPAAAAAWAAAAAAWEWAASTRIHAAWRAEVAAWAARSRADEVIKQVAEAGRFVIDAQGLPNLDAVGRMVEKLRRAADAMNRAADAFGRSYKLNKAAKAWQMRACRASRRAADPANATALRDRAVSLHKQALGEADMRAATIKEAAYFLRVADTLAAGSAKWAADSPAKRAADSPAKRAAACREWSGERDALARAQADMWEHAKRKHLESAALAEQAKDAERAVARTRELLAALAEREADAAAAAARGRVDPDAKAAAAAWRKAMAVANRAEAEDRASRGGAAGAPEAHS